MTASTIRSERLLPVAIGALLLSGCTTAGPDPYPSISVAATSQAASTWQFSSPDPVDPGTALTGLTSAIAARPDEYGGVTVVNQLTGATRATVHLIAGTKLTPDVSAFMLAATEAGVAVSTDTVQWSTTDLDGALSALPRSPSLRSQPGLLTSARIDVDSNAVVAQVGQLTPDLSAAVAAEFGSKVRLRAADASAPVSSASAS